MVKRTVKVENENGIHARPASLFVRAAEKFRSNITITYDGKTANAKELIMVMSMNVPKGADVTIQANGVDAAEAVETLGKILKSHFEPE